MGLEGTHDANNYFRLVKKIDIFYCSKESDISKNWI